MKIKLLSAVVLNGIIQKEGVPCDVPERLGKSLIARDKAVAVSEEEFAELAKAAQVASSSNASAQQDGEKPTDANPAGKPGDSGKNKK